MVTVATNSLHRQSSNNTTSSLNEHQFAEHLKFPQNPAKQIIIAPSSSDLSEHGSSAKPANNREFDIDGFNFSNYAQ